MIRKTSRGVSFAVRLTPRGGCDRIEGWMQDQAGRVHLKVRVSAPPDEGRANAALIELLAKTLGVPKSRVAITKGQTARNKILEIEGDETVLKTGLQALGDGR